MSRFLFLVSGLVVILSFAARPSSAQATSSGGGPVPTARRSLEEAIAAIRSKEPHSGSSFRLIREVPSSAIMRESGVGDGVFIDLMRAGGFVILEVDDENWVQWTTRQFVCSDDIIWDHCGVESIGQRGPGCYADGAGGGLTQDMEQRA